MAIERFEQLEAWRHAHGLVLQIYKLSAGLGIAERYGLAPQRRRAAVSIPANIAEAFKRRTRRDKAHFYNVAQSSLEELRYYVILCRDLGYFQGDTSLDGRFDTVGQLLTGLSRATYGTRPSTFDLPPSTFER